MQIYNSLTKKKEEFIPLDPKGKKINMYSCGVTVYDKCHIGHARSLYVFDVIKRYLKFREYDVCFVRNITDVDDKIINKANQLGMAFEEVVSENIEFYKKDLKSLGISEADIEPRATENIPDMVKHIEKLIEKGFAYEVEGDVYFCVRKFADYGKLSGQSIDNIKEAVRIDADEKKKDPLDFALWKKSKDREPSWPSPWGEGRPGWHIECSVMSLKYLDCQTLDIHAGGRDLIFPHHENEIAQAEALTGEQFAKIWIHHGLLKINGQKMAKSLGNFIAVEDALKKYAVNDVKMFFLSSHYSSEIDFSDNSIQEAHKKIQRMKIFVRNARMRWGKDPDDSDVQLVEDYKIKFVEAMDDDFNTPKALGVLFELINEANKLLGQKAGTAAADVIVDFSNLLSTVIDTSYFH